MTAMSATTRTRSLRRATRSGLGLMALCAITLASGCTTGHPQPIGASTLAEAETFPYYRVYWVGPRFGGYPLAAADGQKGYISSVGDSVYYGDCVHAKGASGSGGCPLPLQITTVIFHLHSNAALGAQRNIIVRGVPATVYDGGRSIEVYSGRVAIDVFSDTFDQALQAAMEMLPINAPGSASADLPPPVYCPGLSGAMDAQLTRVMEDLPGQPCQRASAVFAFAKRLAYPIAAPELIPPRVTPFGPLKRSRHARRIKVRRAPSRHG
jgi:hypothetical protein